MNGLFAGVEWVVYGSFAIAALWLFWHMLVGRKRGHEREVVLRVYLAMETAGNRAKHCTEPAGEASDQNSEEKGEREPNPTRFGVDSLTLQRSFQFLCGSRKGQSESNYVGFRERFHYVTGLRVDESTFVIGHIVPVEYAHQSAGGVRVADISSVETLTWLDEVGLPLVCHAHSHPGFGAAATIPSITDRQFQERLERGGHVAIGVIFSRDGHCRFFGGEDRHFVVDVQGNGVEKVEHNVYRLTLVDGDVPVNLP